MAKTSNALKFLIFKTGEGNDGETLLNIQEEIFILDADDPIQ